MDKRQRRKKLVEADEKKISTVFFHKLFADRELRGRRNKQNEIAERIGEGYVLAYGATPCTKIQPTIHTINTVTTSRWIFTVKPTF